MPYASFIKPLVWTMTKKVNNDTTGAFLLLLLFLLVLNFLKASFSLSEPVFFPKNERVFIQVAEGADREHVYGFVDRPRIRDVLIKAGLFRRGIILDRPVPSNGKERASWEEIPLGSGTRIEAFSAGGEMRLRLGEMSAFHKMTFGISISVNKESAEGLTAIPGIGPKTAQAIVRERLKRGGFRSIEEILTVPGMGPSVFRKVSPYLKL